MNDARKLHYGKWRIHYLTHSHRESLWLMCTIKPMERHYRSTEDFCKLHYCGYVRFTTYNNFND